VKHAFAACAELSAAYFAHPARALDCYGITGTKGKTTSCHLLAHLLEAGGRKPALLSTVIRTAGSLIREANNTTPVAFELQAWLRIAANEGNDSAIIETTSIGLAEERVRRIGFRAVALTNIGSDHLQYHGGFEPYVAQKRRLFEDPTVVRADAVRIVNADDRQGALLKRRLGAKCVTFGSTAPADYSVAVLGQQRGGLLMNVSGHRLWSPLFGRINAQNVACAVALARELGVAWTDIRDGVASFHGVPGRLELVSEPTEGPAVIVDYAHTPESIQGVISAIRGRYRGRQLTVVVGCSGGTDREKRPKIANIAARRSHRLFLTADNSRWESAETISREMLHGIPKECRSRTRVVIDRREAIEQAIRTSTSKGVVAILGRGCESHLDVQGRRVPFDDRDVARSILHGQD
jgi:UDP-N-acetylmuramoyl-L-alanyl-D-glutamate--2,6-diaminopimelate ligase